MRTCTHCSNNPDPIYSIIFSFSTYFSLFKYTARRHSPYHTYLPLYLLRWESVSNTYLLFILSYYSNLSYSTVPVHCICIYPLRWCHSPTYCTVLQQRAGISLKVTFIDAPASSKKDWRARNRKVRPESHCPRWLKVIGWKSESLKVIRLKVFKFVLKFSIMTESLKVWKSLDWKYWSLSESLQIWLKVRNP
jgi:hypothetical protein